MKYTKTVKIEIEITDELINLINEEYEDADFHDMAELKGLLDEVLTLNPYGALTDLLGDDLLFDLTTITNTSEMK